MSRSSAMDSSVSKGGHHCSESILEAQNVARYFPLKGTTPWSRQKGVIRAVDGVSFRVRRNDTLALVGESGCGKSTTAKLLLGLDEPTSGTVRFQGAPLFGLARRQHHEFRRSVQAVFQNPSGALSPRRRVRQILAEPLITLNRLKKREAADRVPYLLAQVGLAEDVGDSLPHQLSGGMKQRVAIAQSLASEPDVIILDEPVSSLDVSMQAEIMNLLRDIQDRRGVSYVLIAHDLATVRYLAQSVAAMYLGEIVEEASTRDFFLGARHPYTLALISAAIPQDTASRRQRIVLRGEIPSPAAPPPGCRFHTRCWLAEALGHPQRCRTEPPKLRVTSGSTHRVACHFLEEVGDNPVRRNLLESLAR